MRPWLVLALVGASALLGPSTSEADCVPGFDFAAFGKDSVRFTGNSGTDSYNSTQTPITRTNSDGDIGTNGSSCGAISLTGSASIYGDAMYGSAGSSCSITSTGSVSITGTKGPQGTNRILPSVTMPLVGLPMGNINCTGKCKSAPAPNMTYGSLKFTGQTSLTLSAGTYRIGSISMTGGSELIVGSGPIVVYVDCSTGDFDLTGGSVTNLSKISTNLVFMLGPQCTSVKTTGGSDASYAMYAPDADIDLVGNSELWGALVGKSVKAVGGANIHYDRALGSLGFGQFECPKGEVSRNAPIAAKVNGTDYLFQGTYEFPLPTKVALSLTNASSWVFSFTKGHLRAKTASSVSTNGVLISSGSPLFDAATKVPSVNNLGCTSLTGGCRRIFTNTNSTPASGVTYRPPFVPLKDANAAAIGAIITNPIVGLFTQAHHVAIIRAILAAPLGGVDRSAVAVIEPSPVAKDGATRPTMAYFGSTDGMLHAVCVTPGGSTPTATNICPSAGTELWAFMPRVQLPLVGLLDTRIDGSVAVIDAFGDFSTAAGTGTKSFRTILTFQVGSSGLLAKGAAYAIDITDPASPQLLWEHTAPTTLASVAFGAGLTTAVGRAMIKGAPTNFAVLQTNNGGTGGAGVVATAVKLETGAQLWQFGSVYPLTALVPASGMPGGAVAVDMKSSGFSTDVVMGDLYGRLWRLDLSTGGSAYGTNPVFKFSTDRHPIGAVPAIYSNGNQLYAAFASGGYTDTLGTSWTTGTQYLIATKLAPTTAPLSETTTACVGSCNLQISQAITGGQLGYAQANIVGTTLSFVTDSANASSLLYGLTQTATGKLASFDLGSNTMSTAVIYAGISSLATVKANGTATLYAGGNDKQQQVGHASSAGGTSVDTGGLPRVIRRLWIKTNQA